MMARRRELDGVFSLQDVEPWGGTVEASDVVSVTTPAAAWAYAAVFPRRSASRASATPEGPVVVEIDATVTRGRVGVGCLMADQQTFLDESIQQEEDGPVTAFLRLDSLAECRWLMLRNGHHDGQPSTAIVRAIRVFLLDDERGQPPFIFDHIYKTGGTTFHHSYLQAAFRPHERFVMLGTMEEVADSRRRLLALPPEEKRTLRVVAGHKAGMLRGSFAGARFLTLVREPVARVVSVYLYACSRPVNREILKRHLGKDAVTLREFVEADILGKLRDPFLSVHDWQARTLLGEDLPAVDGMDAASLMDAVGSRFRVVGYTEALELFLFFLHRTEGFPLALFNNRLVRGAGGLRVTPEDLAAIHRFNAADTAVYRAVRQAFDRRVAEVWNDEVERDYRWYRARLDSFRHSSGGDPNMMRLLRC